ncbi:MAG: hypothetical protein K0Q79_3587 [Flavipsychrobacter sp.]|jgi:hypothetical protein|nr:hypothetical protein [Flavipsychrobacter sp.]
MKKRYLYILAILLVLPWNNPCYAQLVDTTKIVNSLTKCWRVIGHNYSTIYGLDEEEVKRYKKQKICFGKDSVKLYYGASYAPKYSVKKVNAEDYARNNFDCSKQKMDITADSVFEITVSSVTKPSKEGTVYKMTDVVAFDGYCLFVMVDGVIFKLFDANAKVEGRSSN